MKRLLDLQQKRNVAVAATRAILDSADAEKRGLTQEESVNYDKAFADIEQFDKSIEQEMRQLEAERKQAAIIVPGAAGAGEDRGASGKGKERAILELLNEERSAGIPVFERKSYRQAFGSMLRHGVQGMHPDELRALQADSDTAGGYLVMPQEMSKVVLQKMDNLLILGGKVSMIDLPYAESLGIPTLENDPDDSDWTSELLTGNEDSTMSFGKRELRPHPVAKRFKASNKLLRSAFIDVEGKISERAAYKMGVTLEKAMMTGDGNQKPLGLFKASADGIPTAQDVSTGNSSTAIAADNLINVKYSLKQQYQAMAEWLFHRDAVKAIAKLKDGQGNYLWQPSFQAGQPDRILNIPVNMSEYAPNTFTTGLYVGLLGVFKNYQVVRCLNMQVQRLVELYAATNQTGFIVRSEIDGAPVMGESFARVTLA